MLRLVDKPATREEDIEYQSLDELARQGARRMLLKALEAEVAGYLERYVGERDDEGHALVVRNGKARPRQVTLGCGTIEIRAPRVNDRRRDARGERQRFTSRILPPYMRRSPKVSEVLPILYLRGLSTGDFRPALEGLLGEEAAGLSPTNIARLTAEWEKEYQEHRTAGLTEKDYVYVWVDGIHFNVRLEEDRLCTLVMIGARLDGTKELIAVEDGYRESAESWASLLRDLKRRGMAAPLVAVGDGALGFWAAARDVWPETHTARCWCHKIANVLDKLPKRLQPQAKRLLHEVMYAETRSDAKEAIERFVDEYESQYPKAVTCLKEDEERLLVHFDYPAEHWKHLRTTNIIESPFSTVRLRTRVTKGAGSRTKALLMAYKLLTMAQERWRKLNGAEFLAQVRAGISFIDGVRQERAKRDEQNIKGKERKREVA